MEHKSRTLYRLAITRKPGENFSDGITSAGLGKPDHEEALRQHASYVEALRTAGMEVIVLAADPRFPDGCFVEDTAVVLPEVAVITSPGAPSRSGETESMADVLKQFHRLARIEGPGTLEGGDVLKAERHFFIGLSERTNAEGIEQFERIVRPFGYATQRVVPGPFLHLKSGIAYIGDGRLIAAPGLAHLSEFRDYHVITVDPEELYAANCLRIAHGTLAVAKGYPRLKQTLLGLGYEITELAMTEYQKMDGGLTCLSLLL